MIDGIFLKVNYHNKTTIQNNHFSLDTIKPGLMDLSSRILGPNSVTQVALPHILFETPDSYYDDILNQIHVKFQLNSIFLFT
jgi:hypothetical protein